MKMKFYSLLVGASLLALASTAQAGQPLTDQQMDKVAAGFDFTEEDINNVGTTLVEINLPPNIPCSTCFLSIQTKPYPSGAVSFQLFVDFGPG